MNSEIYDAILTNTFTDSLMDFKIDEQAFSELCRLLERLAVVWSSESVVDKEVVMHMYHTTHIIRNRLAHFREHSQTSAADRLENMFTDLDRLFGEQCLQTSK